MYSKPLHNNLKVSQPSGDNLNSQSWPFRKFRSAVVCVCFYSTTLARPYRYLNSLSYLALVISPWLRFLKFTSRGNGSVTQNSVIWTTVLALSNPYPECCNCNKGFGLCLEHTRKLHCYLGPSIEDERIPAVFKLKCFHLFETGQLYLLINRYAVLEN